MNVVKLFVPGVGGATAEEMIRGRPTQIAGDERAGFFVGEADGSSEVYEWGRLTSGPTTSAAWWVLLPFSLFNVAGWMLPEGRTTDTGHGVSWEEGPEREKPAASLLWWARLIIVLGGGLLTALYLVWISTTLVGLALACGDAGAAAECADRGPLKLLLLFAEEPSEGVFVVEPVWQLAVGVTAALLAWFALLWYVQRSHTLEWFERDSARRAAAAVCRETGTDQSRLERNTRLDDARFWYRWSEYRRLWRWHLSVSAVTIGAVAGLCYLALDPGGGPHPWVWSVAMPAVVLVAGFALVSDAERSPASGEQRPTRAPAWTLLWGMLYAAVAFAVAAAIVRLDPGFFAGAETPVSALLVAVIALSIVMSVLALVLLGLQLVRAAAAKGARSRMLMPLFAAAFAVMVAGGGLGSIYVLAGRALLGRERFGELGADTTFPEILLLAVTLAAIAWLVGYLTRKMPRSRIVEQYFPEHDVEARRLEFLAPEKTAPTLDRRRWRWVKAVRRKRRSSEAGRHGHSILALVVVFAFVVQVTDYLIANRPITDTVSKPLFGIGFFDALHPWAAGIIVAYVFPGIWVMRRAVRDRAQRRTVAKVWDVIGFWPRRFHPFAAPSYAERAVPEVRERVKLHLREGNAVALLSHSQGTVIAYAVLQGIAGETRAISGCDDTTLAELREEVPADTPEPAQYEAYVRSLRVEEGTKESRPRRRKKPEMPREIDLSRVALVTYGSPLSQLYGPNFPAHFGVEGSFRSLRDQLSRVGAQPGWRNFYRPTDFIGKKVFVAPGGLLMENGEVFSSGEEAERCPVPRGGPPDPDTYVCEAAEPLFPPRAHSNYEDEPVVMDWIDAVSRALSKRRRR